MKKRNEKHMYIIGSGGGIPKRTLNCRKMKGLFMAKATKTKSQETTVEEKVPAAHPADRRFSRPGYSFLCMGKKETQDLIGEGVEGVHREFRGRNLQDQ